MSAIKLVIIPFEITGKAVITGAICRYGKETFTWGQDEPTVDSVAALVRAQFGDVLTNGSLNKDCNFYKYASFAITPTQTPNVVIPKVHKDGRICALLSLKTYNFSYTNYNNPTHTITYSGTHMDHIKLYHVPIESIQIV